MSSKIEEYEVLGIMIKEKGPVRLVAEQGFRAFVTKAFEAAGFNHSAMHQIDEMIIRLAKEAGQPVANLKIGVEVAARSRSAHSHAVKCNVVPVVALPGQDEILLVQHFDGMEADSGYTPLVDPNRAYNYWKDKWENDPEVSPGATLEELEALVAEKKAAMAKEAKEAETGATP